MKTIKAFWPPFSVLVFLVAYCLCVSARATLGSDNGGEWRVGTVVKRDQRRPIAWTEYGEISAVEISDGTYGSYHLEFLTLEPNALFLPVVLHADMVFHVHSGSGILSWTSKDEIKRLDIRRGDVYRLQPGTVLFVQSNLEPQRQKLRIHAIFANSDADLREQSIGAYSSIRDLILGFDKRILQAAFKVPEEVIEDLTNGTRQPAIIHGVPQSKKKLWEIEDQFLRAFAHNRGFGFYGVNKKKEKSELFNLMHEDHDFENRNGWSTTVTQKKLSELRGSKIGVLMVNLTKGSMMGPHWNPSATEIAIVTQGRGMVRVVSSSCPTTETGCQNTRFKVEEGDVFTVPRFHPMAQMSFGNETFVFVGFSTSTDKKNHPQYLVGKSSVIHTLDRGVLAASFNASNATIDQLLATPKGDSIILGCMYCAEEEEKLMEEEIEKAKEEARKREEEEARRREEEKQQQEEEAKKGEEEEARRREEEKKREEEEEAKRQEEEEEEERQRREEEEAKKREEEQRREEEAAARKRAEEEARRQREEEEAEKREEERRREEEEAARKRVEEEARRRREEEEAAKMREEEAKRRAAEEARRQGEAEQRRREEEARREEEEARREEEEREQQEGGGGGTPPAQE